ncbi:GNAT family N-acetyltransferase [Janthinobacterium aquaticum]|uniref:GNAT family N-acetyltransferase n=1 Tax=Janthinobacterium sp. FT58W TaxID=2654254 RepID=UPI0012656172|nr:GNAT family N-acetyltransferase [Janthinobacterium sp. FT58W]KAB8045130.1 GNAT family N-acetyltransferase [Janthinobacterium sp. FT58W]
MTYEKTIETERLILRKPHPADAPALFAIHADPEVMRYFSELPWQDDSRAAGKIADDIAAFEKEESFRFAVELKATGQYMGSCSLFAEHRQNRRAEIGYVLGRPYWGHGYMQEALSALLEFAFVERNLNRLEADIDPLNTASASALERQGFRREGFLPERWIVGGQVSDTALYGLLRREWEARRNAGSAAAVPG